MPAKILLADKSITIQKVVEMLFSGREYEVVCVSDGEMALQEAERVLPGVILADVDLPRVDGYSLAMQLKKNPTTMQMPVILMMSRDDVYDNAKGKQTRIVDKIVKPFESQELISKVKKALASAPARPTGPAPAISLPSQPVVITPLHTSQPVVTPPPVPPSNIFDIISDAPTHAELKQKTMSAEEEFFYEVEPVVEEVKATPAREEEKALPTGAKAVEEIRAGLGLSETSEEFKPETVTFKSFDTPREAAPPKQERPSPAASHPVAQSAQLSVLPMEEIKKIVTEAVTKMAKDIFKDMPPPPMPKISDETIKRGIQEAVTKVASELARGIIEQVAWEVIPQLAEHLIKEEIERIKAETK
jgi:CheY-like chemotaxis protein